MAASTPGKSLQAYFPIPPLPVGSIDSGVTGTWGIVFAFLITERDHYESIALLIWEGKLVGERRKEVQGSSPMLCFDF